MKYLEKTFSIHQNIKHQPQLVTVLDRMVEIIKFGLTEKYILIKNFFILASNLSLFSFSVSGESLL